MPGVICNIVVIADLGRSPGRSTSSRDLPVDLNGNFGCLPSRIGRSPGRSTPQLTSSGQEWQLADTCTQHLVVKNEPHIG